MKNKLSILNRFPLYIFLLPVFFILHVYNRYFGLLDFEVVSTYLAYYLLVALGLFFLAKLFLKSSVKSAVLCSVMQLIFFFFGAVHDQLKIWSLPPFFLSYSFLLSMIAVFCLAVFFKLKKSKDPQKLHRIFRIFFSLIFLVESFFFLFNLSSGKAQKSMLGYNNTEQITIVPDSNSRKLPDIFFFVFDAYASSIALKKYHGYDNSWTDSMLAHRGFFIADSSQSNYNSTPVSLGSCFEMRYYNTPLEGSPNNAELLMRGAQAFDKSLLPKLLSPLGYEIVNHGMMRLADEAPPGKAVFDEYQEKALYLETLWGRVKRDILWNLIVRVKKDPFDLSDPAAVAQNKQNFSSFHAELIKTSDQPRLVYGHVLLPRRPLLVDAKGQPRRAKAEDLNEENYDSLYIDQVKFANTWIDSLSRTVRSIKSDRPVVLIIIGDHGNRYGDRLMHLREKQFMNLHAIYFSDGGYDKLYRTVSPVNSFRQVLNRYFNSQLPMLNDSTILLSNSNTDED